MADPKQTPNAPAAAPAKGDTKPGAKGSPKAKKEKRVKVPYAVPEGGLESYPEDFDPKKHKPLKRTDFKNELVYLEKRREKLAKSLASLDTEIETVKKLGPGKERQKAKKLLKVQREFDELKKTLAEQGVDVASLLGGTPSE